MKKISNVNLGLHILELEITTRCNLNCKHCYNRTFVPFDMPIERIIQYFRFAEKYNVWTLVITGGEAVLHPDFDKLVKFLKGRKHKTRLVLHTNGTLLDDKNIAKIRVFDLIHISYDACADVRKEGIKNLQLAKKLKEKNIKCYLFSTVHQKNKNLIDRMVKNANQAKIPIGFNLCLPTDKLSPDLLMAKEEFGKIEKKLNDLYLEGKTLRYSSPLVSIFSDKTGKTDKIKGGCSAGVASCLITPQGELFPCPFMRISAGNVYKESLETLWLKSRLFESLRDRRHFANPCGECELLAYCGGCRNRAFRSSGDLKGADPMCYKDKIKRKG